MPRNRSEKEMHIVRHKRCRHNLGSEGCAAVIVEQNDVFLALVCESSLRTLKCASIQDAQAKLDAFPYRFLWFENAPLPTWTQSRPRAEPRDALIYALVMKVVCDEHPRRAV